MKKHSSDNIAVHSDTASLRSVVPVTLIVLRFDVGKMPSMT